MCYGENVLWFSPDILQLLCLSAAFCSAELSPTTTRCCSFGLLAAYMSLSGTSVNHRDEAEQSVGHQTWFC